jgi:hypothetical protein
VWKRCSKLEGPLISGRFFGAWFSFCLVFLPNPNMVKVYQPMEKADQSLAVAFIWKCVSQQEPAEMWNFGRRSDTSRHAFILHTRHMNNVDILSRIRGEYTNIDSVITRAINDKEKRASRRQSTDDGETLKMATTCWLCGLFLSLSYTLASNNSAHCAGMLLTLTRMRGEVNRGQVVRHRDFA